jgi:hypothetical protein
MSQDFKNETIVLKSSPEDKINNFLKDLRNLLDKHKAKLYSSDCELYLDNIGYVGSLEDNIDCVEITDGYEVLYSSLK